MAQAAADYQQVLEFDPNHPQADQMREFIRQHGPGHSST